MEIDERTAKYGTVSNCDDPFASGIVVKINIYDIADNSKLYMIGLGVHHTGIEINGKEYSFGFHPEDYTGIFSVTPREAPNARFRESIILGHTKYSYKEIEDFVYEMGREYRGKSYDPLTRNCNHFCDDFSFKLLQKRVVPRWVNRLARLGSYFKCILPLEKLGIKLPTAYDGENPQLQNTYEAFSGNGYVLNGSAEDDTPSISTESVSCIENDLEAKRKLFLEAAEKRMSKKQDDVLIYDN